MGLVGLNEKFSKNVLYYRRMRKLAQPELGRRAKLSTRHISDIENLKANVTLAVVEKLAAALKIPSMEMLL